MVRFLVSILLGAAITFALFSFMAFLVASGDSNKEEQLESIIVEVNTTPPKSAAERRQRVPPPPPPPPKHRLSLKLQSLILVIILVV